MSVSILYNSESPANWYQKNKPERESQMLSESDCLRGRRLSNYNLIFRVYLVQIVRFCTVINFLDK